MKRDEWDFLDRQLAPPIRALAAEARHGLASHPSTDELVAYHRQALAAEVAEALRDHLALCPDCARRGLDLAAFVEPCQTTPARPEPGFLAALDAQLARLFGSLRFAYGLAALFLITTLALAWRGGGGGPEANPQLVDLFPVGVTERGPAAPEMQRIVAGSGYLLLSLAASPGELWEGAVYRAEILELGVASPRSWSLEVEPTAEDFFTLGIPDGALAAGSYGIKIFADGVVVAEYRFEIEEGRSGRPGQPPFPPP